MLYNIWFATVSLYKPRAELQALSALPINIVTNYLSVTSTLNGAGATVKPGRPSVEGHGSPSGILNLNSCMRVQKVRNNILLARISSRHTRFPTPNWTNHSSLKNLPSASRNRSGLKTSGSPQWSRSCRTPHMLTMNVVFYGNIDKCV